MQCRGCLGERRPGEAEAGRCLVHLRKRASMVGGEGGGHGERAGEEMDFEGKANIICNVREREKPRVVSRF